MICVSERSLLPVFVAAKDRSTFVDRLREAVRSIMEDIGVASSLIEGELNEMSQVRIGTTLNRRVVGSLNELSFLLLDQGSQRRCQACDRSCCGRAEGHRLHPEPADRDCAGNRLRIGRVNFQPAGRFAQKASFG